MKVLKLFAVSALLVFSQLGLASEALTQQFANEFYTHYIPGKCGQNIMNLIQRAQAQGLDLSSAHILEIKNEGSSVFGMVRAEYARGAGRPYNPQPGPAGFRSMPGGANWYFHAVLELDGLIYDFDFGNEPLVTPVAEYFETMFLDEKDTSVYTMFKVGRERKLQDYLVTISPAVEFMSGQPSVQKQSLPLGQYLSGF